jgi:hypothetical protein
MAAGPAVAQTVGGRVVSGDRDPQPVAGALVILLDSTGVAHRAVLTDALGRYVLSAPAPGSYMLQVRRAGNTAVATEPFLLVGAATAHLDLRLAPRVYTLKPVTVVSDAASAPVGMLAGFYQRMARGWGSYITREEIRKRGARQISELLYGRPDVRVIRRSELQSTVRVGTELSRLNVGPLSLGEDGTPQLAADAPLPCSPMMYVDGVAFGRADDVLDQVGPTDIEGIEIYRRATEVPPEFGGLQARCGVILVWTRRAQPGM